MTDIRSIKTREKLRNALTTLLRANTYEKISISDITDEAHINRVTFYTHYQDKDELLKDVIDNFAQKYASTAQKAIEEKVSQNIPSEYIFMESLTPFIDYCIDNSDLLTNISRAKNGLILSYFSKAISDVIYPLSKKYARQSIKHAYSFSSTFMIAGYIEIVFQWINNHSEPKEEFLKEVEQFTLNLIRSELMYSHE